MSATKKPKRKRIKLIVDMPWPPGITAVGIKDYVTEAIECWAASFGPEHPLYGACHGEVKVHSPRKNAKKKGADDERDNSEPSVITVRVSHRKPNDL